MLTLKIANNCVAVRILKICNDKNFYAKEKFSG